MATPGVNLDTTDPRFFKNLVQAELTAAEVTYYTVPADTKTVVTFLTFGVKQIKKTSVWLVKSGDATALKNAILFEVEPDSQSSQFQEVQYTLEVGDFIVAQTEDVDSISLRIDGVEFPI